MEPFFTHALPCESCGTPVDFRKPAEWDATLLVGPCCAINFSVPDVPVCPEMLAAISQCSLVSDVSMAMQAHRECCEVCQVVIASHTEASIVVAMAERAQEDRPLVDTLQEAGCTEVEIRAWMRQEAA
jgi:hypothetical protein